MNVFAMLAAGGSGQSSFSRTFTANGTWNAPATTSQIDSASGKGADGSPASSGTSYRMYKYQYRVHNYANGGTDVGPARLLENLSTTPGATPPGSYCDPLVSGSDGSPGITVDGTYYPVTSWQDCYYYEYHEIPYDNPATTGQSTTAFGRTFPGGSGGPASTTTFSNIAVTPNASYSIVVPSGGSLTITWRA